MPDRRPEYSHATRTRIFRLRLEAHALPRLIRPPPHIRDDRVRVPSVHREEPRALLARLGEEVEAAGAVLHAPILALSDAGVTLG